MHTAERSYLKNADMQGSLKSLYGLVLASGPILSHCKLQATGPPPPPLCGPEGDHSPHHRMLGTYLINQYLHHHDGKTADWELSGIAVFYPSSKRSTCSG